MSGAVGRFLTRALHALENAQVKSVVRTLRRDGHPIAIDLSLGRRVQIDVHGSGSLGIGSGVRLLQDTWIIVEDGDRMDIGNDVFISRCCTVSGSVTIGHDSLIAAFVTILDAGHVFDDSSRPIRVQGGRKAPVRIGEDVWIGTGTVVLPGVHIGDHAVIGANSTVTHDIPSWALAAGSPARVLRSRRP